MNQPTPNPEKWSENVIIVDADHVDRVAFDLIVNFERMIGRRIPAADMARWLECIALDGGVREGKNNIHTILIHNKDSRKLNNFMPGDFEKDIDGKAFQSNLGEFTMAAVTVEEMVTKERLLTDIVQFIGSRPEVKRLMVVPDDETTYESVRKALHHASPDLHAMLFAMQPMPGGNFKQEILGYSLMSALGIGADEIR
ncbi:MAG: hypothetical protein PUK16_02195 [Prevotellaceae bacterium]|nr:hypothetical protein [Prevotellaceae bacterium]MDY2632972.1 DUF6621 family protein [Prevotella sp.]